MFIFGIDPGKTGGIAALDSGGKIVDLWPMPVVNEEVSASLLAEIFTRFKRGDQTIEMVAIEKVQSLPRDGHVGAFRFGFSYGVARATVEALGFSHTLIRPQEWMKVMHQGTRDNDDKKARSFERATQLWPSEVTNFFASARCKKPHSGLVEAALIARYYWEKNLKQK